MKDAVSAEIQAAQVALEPADPQTFAVGTVQLVRFCRAFGMTFDAEALTAIYRDNAGHLPGDLWLQAVSRTTKAWKYQTPPKPADLCATVADELKKRKARLHLAQTARLAM
jgi:hypothetical protein